MQFFPPLQISFYLIGTVIVMNLPDLSNAPGIRTAENSEQLSDKIAQLVSTTNSVQLLI